LSMPCEALSREYLTSILRFLRLIPLGEGSGTPTEPHHTPSLEAQTTSHTTHPTSSLLPVTTTSIPTVTPLPETTPIRHYTMRFRIARATIAKSSTLPHDLAPRVTSQATVEGTTVLASGVVNVPTGSGSIPTASTPAEGSVPTGSEEVPTASPVFATATVVTPYRRRKGKEFMSTAMIETTEEGTKILATVDGIVRTVSESSFRHYTRRFRIAQSSVPLTVADEHASPQRDVSQGEAFPTDSGFLEDQDRATIAKSSTLPHDSAPRVTSHATVEGRSGNQSTKGRVKLLEERKGAVVINSEDDAPIKGRSMDEGEAVSDGEAVAERVSDDTEEMATVLTSMDAATVLAIPTSSEEVPTASPVFATATVVTPYRRRKGKEVMRKAEQIARDAEIARIHAEEELWSMIDGLDSNNETVAKYLEEYHQFSSELPMERRIELISDLVKYQDNYTKVKDFKGMTFEEVEAKFNSVCKQMEDFIPMGSKEEAERIKRKEFTEEKIKEMMQLIPIEEVYVEELQVKHPIIDWKVHSEGQRSYWKITRLGGSSACYQFFIDLLKHLDREDLNQLWRLVKETLSTRPPTSDKEMELWVGLSRLYEPDKEDQLWTHTQNFMHALVDWNLYDSCGVHHVTSKDKKIFMLVEKDYLLRKGLALVMICYKLQVENFLQMVNHLVLKIYKIANTPRQQGD
nr:hypothetical protein [Tanacetum cinerariifolium]